MVDNTKEDLGDRPWRVLGPTVHSPGEHSDTSGAVFSIYSNHGALITRGHNIYEHGMGEGNLLLCGGRRLSVTEAGFGPART